MVQKISTSNVLIIVLSMLAALILDVIPLPHWLMGLRPEWVALVLLFWVLTLPHHVKLGIAWIAGLMLDALQNTLLGEHALAMVIITYLAFKIHQQFRFFPPWQQAFTIMLLIAIFQFLRFWVQGIIGQLGAGWFYWLPVFTSGLLWPSITHLLCKFNRKLVVY
jgi:rod shape-determining protein MreD